MISTCEVCDRPYPHRYKEKHMELVPKVCGPDCFNKLLRKPYSMFYSPKGMNIFHEADDNMRSNYERGMARWLLLNGIVYMYETFIFDLPDGDRYVPDFYIARSQIFLEVKGLWESGAMNKVMQFRKTYKFRLFVINRGVMSHLKITPTHVVL